MPRRPLSDSPMTNAERQARHRAARAAALPVIHYRRAADRAGRSDLRGADRLLGARLYRLPVPATFNAAIRAAAARRGR